MIHSVKRLGEINKQGSDRATLIQCTAPVPSHLVNIPVRPSFSYIVSPYTCGQLWRPRAGCHRWQQPGRRRAVQITVGEFFAIFHSAIHPPCMYTLCICGVFLEINFIVMHSLHCFHLVRPDVCPVPSARPLSVPASPLLCNNGIVRGTDKSIINMLLPPTAGRGINGLGDLQQLQFESTPLSALVSLALVCRTSRGNLVENACYKGSRKRSNFQALWRNSFWSGVEQRRRLLVGDGVYVGLMGCFVV